MRLNLVVNFLLWTLVSFEQPNCILARGTGKERRSVIVIGAGVSGIAAAAKLVKTGQFSVRVLEASNRIGGRIFSDKFDGRFVEIGAEWIHGQQGNPVYELVSPVSPDLLVDDAPPYWTGGRYRFVTQSGVVLNKSVNKRVISMIDTINEDSHDYTVPFTSRATVAKEIYEAAEPIHHSASVRAAILDFIHRAGNAYDAADNWENTPFHSVNDSYTDASGNQNVAWKEPYTYSALLSIILTGVPANIGSFEIPSWIHLNQEVVQISYSPNANAQVRVTCQDGTQLTADHVISTVSLGVLKAKYTTLFQPNLPDKKQTAINSIHFGTVNKIMVGFETPWWPTGDGIKKFWGFNLLWEDFDTVGVQWKVNATSEELLAEHDGIPAWCRSLLAFQTMEKHPTTLRAWISGPTARFVETLDPDYVKTTCHKVMKKFMGHFFDIPEPSTFRMSAWYSNPFVRGSYSCRTIIADKNNVYAVDLAEPIYNSDGKPIICFGGEASSSRFYGNVHGGYDAGIREADRLIGLTY